MEADLKANVACHGAWVEHKNLLVAWHYRGVDKSMKSKLMIKAKEIYAKHKFEVLTVSKRFENVPPMGWDRGDSAIHILKWMFGLDWEERVKVVYVGDSAADEFAISRLKGVAYNFRVINEDASVITKTSANYRLEGPDGVLSLLKYLEKQMLGRTPKSLSRASSFLSLDNSRDFVEMITDEPNTVDQVSGTRRRTSSLGSKAALARSRTSSLGSNASLRRKTLNTQLQTKLSREEQTL